MSVLSEVFRLLTTEMTFFDCDIGEDEIVSFNMVVLN